MGKEGRLEGEYIWVQERQVLLRPKAGEADLVKVWDIPEAFEWEEVVEHEPGGYEEWKRYRKGPIANGIDIWDEDTVLVCYSTSNLE